MPQHKTSFTLAATALAVTLMLAACGGGDPVGTPDTVPPTVAITDNVPEATATGPVTFTFTFSESVGTTFVAEDVVVVGGTSGTFTRLSGTVATLVVTPTPNAQGTIEVSVAAIKFTDAAGNNNSATASASQAYDTRPPASPSGSTGTCTAAPCVNFDAAGYAMVAFGALGAEIVADPLDATNKVAKLVKVPASEVWAGATFDPSGTGAGVVPAFDFGASKTVTLRVWAAAAGELFMLKVENASNGGVFMEARATTTRAGAWETLTFDFAAPSLGSFNATATYDRVSVFPHYDTNVTSDKTFYVDELKYTAKAASGGSGGGSGGGTAILTFDESPAPTLTPFGINGADAPALVADPAGGSNKVLKVSKVPGSEQWAGVTISNLANDAIPRIPFTADKKTITMRVYSPAVGVRVRMKVEDAGNNGISVETDAITTTANEWETLTFNFANPGTSPPVGGGATSPLDLTKNYTRLSVFSDFGLGQGGIGALPAARVYYYDDIAFGGTTTGGTGGGSGGGAVSPITISTGFASGSRTVQGGEVGGFSGSNLDNFSCNGQPENCGGGGEFAPAIAAADSYLFYYYQTPSPASALYVGMYVQPPGVTGGLSPSADTPGVSISGQTTMKFKLGMNPEWFSSSTKNFMVQLDLGKRYLVGGNPCHVQLRRVVAPTAAAATAYSVNLSSFAVVQNCGIAGLTTTAALAGSPISLVSFQGAGGGSAVSDGTLTTGANLSVPAGAVYPSTLVLVGGITLE